MIFWKYLKGLNEGVPSEGVTPQLFTYFTFSNENYIANSRSKLYLPKIYINSFNSFPISNSSPDITRCLGYIITSDATSQSMNEDFTITEEKHLYFGDSNSWIKKYTEGSDSSAQDIFKIYTDNDLYFDSKSSIYFRQYVNYYSSETSIWANVLVISHREVNSTDRGLVSVSFGDLEVSGYGNFTNYCKAAYFDATSDKRAKTNIKPLSINALELINKTPLYSFKYKDSDLPSIGIIAQDVQNIDIEGFKLVDNEQASGKDYDYMSIHESKLTYILWKAVQEQQALIKDLQAQINELKKN